MSTQQNSVRLVVLIILSVCWCVHAAGPQGKQRLVLAQGDRELNAYDLNDGSRVWTFAPEGLLFGSTPAVDQDAGLLYYQSRGNLWKINAVDGALMERVTIPSSQPLGLHTTATVLADDDHGYYIICYYFRHAAYGGSIRVYDRELNLVWMVDGLNTWLKTIPVYHDGVVYVGTGEAFQYSINHEWYAGEKEDARVIAYNIKDGTVKWVCEIDPEALYRPLANRGISQVLYCNGYIIGASSLGGGEDGSGAQIYVIDAQDGTLKRKFTHDARSGACGFNALSFGRLYRGDLTSRSTTVFEIGTGEKNDFAPYGVHQVNHAVAPASSLQTLHDEIKFLGNVRGERANGAQGSIVHDGIVYACDGRGGGGVLAFDAETLEVVREFDSGGIWDSSPMVVENNDGDAVLIVLSHTMNKVRAYNASTGEHLWDNEGDQVGRYVFGFTYYDRAVR